MASSGIPDLDKLLGGDGYPDRSSVLVTGAPGIGKEALGYWFVSLGLSQGDFCLYVTRLATQDVLRDANGFGVDFRKHVPFWIAQEGGELKYDYRDLAGLSFSIKDVLKKQAGRRIRIVADVFSSLLSLTPPETIYKFVTQLLVDVKHYDAVILATLEDGMHQQQVVTTMQSNFDGVFEMRVYEEGMSYVPVLRVRKMLGLPPLPGYFSYSFTRTGMEIGAYAKRV